MMRPHEVVETLHRLLASADQTTGCGFAAVNIASSIVSMYSGTDFAEILDDADNYVGVIMYAKEQNGPAFTLFYDENHLEVSPIRRNVFECVRDVQSKGYFVVDDIT